MCEQRSELPCLRCRVVQFWSVHDIHESLLCFEVRVSKGHARRWHHRTVRTVATVYECPTPSATSFCWRTPKDISHRFHCGREADIFALAQAGIFAVIVKNLGSTNSDPSHSRTWNGSLTPGIYPENFVPGGQPVPEIFGDKWGAGTRRGQLISIHEPTACG